MPVCPKCGVDQPDEHFRPKRRWCHGCIKKANSDYYRRNTDSIRIKTKEYVARNARKINQRRKKYAEANRDIINAKARDYRKANSEKAKAVVSRWMKANRQRRRDYMRQYMSTPMRKLHRSISSRMGQSLKGRKSGTSWELLVGFSLAELKNHLERHWFPGMTWSNYGHGKGKWNIDHCKPVSWFKFSSPDDPDFKQCWGLNNLQPLWQSDNCRKQHYFAHSLLNIEEPESSHDINRCTEKPKQVIGE